VTQTKPRRGTSPTTRSAATAARVVQSDAIAEKAHALFVARGGGHGYDLDDWLEAERQLGAAAKKPAARASRAARSAAADRSAS
jgi:hypothetical protein